MAMGRTARGSVQRWVRIADAMRTPTASEVAHVAARTDLPSRRTSPNPLCWATMMIQVTNSVDARLKTRPPATAATIDRVSKEPRRDPRWRAATMAISAAAMYWPALKLTFIHPRRRHACPTATAVPKAMSSSTRDRVRIIGTRNASSRWMFSPCPSCDSIRGITWSAVSPIVKIRKSHGRGHMTGAVVTARARLATPATPARTHKRRTRPTLGPRRTSSSVSACSASGATPPLT